MQTHTNGLPFPELPASLCCSVTVSGCLSVGADAEQGQHRPQSTHVQESPPSQPGCPSKPPGTRQAGSDQSKVWSQWVLHFPSHPHSTGSDCKKTWSDGAVAALLLSRDVIWMVSLQALHWTMPREKSLRASPGGWHVDAGVVGHSAA